MKKTVVEYALCFEFLAMNNEAEYEDLTIGLWIAKELEIQDPKACSDFQLIVEYIQDNYKVRGENMIKYLQKIKDLTITFDKFKI